MIHAMDSQYGATDRLTLNEVSPELALVDPTLAAHARDWLPDPGDTIRRVERLVQAHRIASARAGRAGALGIPERFREPHDQRPTTRPGSAHRRPVVLAGSLAAGALVAALLVGVRVDLGGSPAGADTAAIGQVPETAVDLQRPNPQESAKPKRTNLQRPNTQASAKPARTKKTPVEKTQRKPVTGSIPTSRATPRRFAWAPVSGASGYHIEFFRGSSLVFSADSTRPEVSIPVYWGFRGKREALSPGEYRWYVWPLISGKRAAGAIVQAKLEIPSR
jgi:hypothetical protein